MCGGLFDYIGSAISSIFGGGEDDLGQGTGGFGANDAVPTGTVDFGGDVASDAASTAGTAVPAAADSVGGWTDAASDAASAPTGFDATSSAATGLPPSGFGTTSASLATSAAPAAATAPTADPTSAMLNGPVTSSGAATPTGGGAPVGSSDITGTASDGSGTAASGSGGGVLGGVGSFLKNNSWLFPALGLGYELTRNNGITAYPQTKQVTAAAQTQTNDAGQLAASANTLTSPLLNNTPLPAGDKAAIDQATDSAKASIRSQYASMGLSGSTMESQALAEVDQNAAQQTTQAATSLAQIGFQNLTGSAGITGSSAQIYQDLLKDSMGSDQQLSSAVGNFANALGGGTSPRQLVSS